MSAATTRLSLTKPGGGSTGLILPPDPVDIDVLNANFDKIDATMGVQIVTSVTRPATPFDGQQIYETDTLNHLYWSSTLGRWVPIGIPNAASSVLRDALFPVPVNGNRVFRTDLTPAQIERYSAAAANWLGDLPDPTFGQSNSTQTISSTVFAALPTPISVDIVLPADCWYILESESWHQTAAAASDIRSTIVVSGATTVGSGDQGNGANGYLQTSTATQSGARLSARKVVKLLKGTNTVAVQAMRTAANGALNYTNLKCIPLKWAQ